MKNNYEIRISKYPVDDWWVWKIGLLNRESEPFITIGLESSMDKAYKAAKKKYDALINAK